MGTCTYFAKTKPRNWCLIEAMKEYEEFYGIREFEPLCARIEEDLSELENKRKERKNIFQSLVSFDQSHNVKSNAAPVPPHVKAGSKDPNCSPETKQTAPTSMPPVVHKLADNININKLGKQVNNFGNASSNKKRKLGESMDEEDDESSNVYLHSPSRLRATTEDQESHTTQVVEPFDDIHRAAHMPTQLILTHGQKQYTIRTPSQAAKHSPHRPKITKSHREALEEYFVFETTFANTGDDEMRALYEMEQEKQKKNRSLVDLGLFSYVKMVLQDIPHTDFPETLWSQSVDCSNSATMFVKVVKYVMTGFHLLSHSAVYPVTDHERTFFVEYVIPGLMAISKMSDSFDFFWCEYEMQSVKEMDMVDKGFNLMKTQRRYIDALAKMTTGSEMEVVVVEASSGPVGEKVVHTIEDTLKIMECTTASLSAIAAKYRHASITTLKKLRVYSVHLIKNKMTLSYTSLNDAYSWRRMDLRTAEIPTKWLDRIDMIRYFELLATLLDGIQTAVTIERQLRDENVGVRDFQGQTVEEALG
ncbi:hypothetical protein BJV82DRAFT_664207 [Fennellomyces sp. T-0311]|nr:hypothetical protein BJV82DRAFT_664207 [Fennellomyces sp. T-0311]